jgi:hypothetical protein
MSKIDTVLDEVAQAQAATGRWYTPTHKHGLLFLNKINVDDRRYSLRVDAIKDSARVYAVGNPIITSIGVFECGLVADDINKTVADMVLKIEAKLGINQH